MLFADEPPQHGIDQLGETAVARILVGLLNGEVDGRVIRNIEIEDLGRSDGKHVAYCGGGINAGSCDDDSSCGNVAGGCQGGYCDVGNGCATDAQCRHGLCITSSSRHFCSKPCCGYYDCPGATTCLPQLGNGGEVYKACVDFPSGSTLSPGGACDPHHPEVCRTGYCLAYDANDSASTSGYCTYTCCTDADCSQPGARCRLEDTRLRYPDGGSPGLTGVCVLP